jgi:hypothetical protein
VTMRTWYISEVIDPVTSDVSSATSVYATAEGANALSVFKSHEGDRRSLFEGGALSCGVSSASWAETIAIARITEA